MIIRRFLLPVGLSSALALDAAPVPTVPDQVAPLLPDVVRPLDPGLVRVDGWLGGRIDANAAHRLAVVDTEPLLAGFRQKPGSHPWIGEHIGKWLHAATLAWAYTGDAALRRKLDGVVAELVAAQEPDGYLGTYLPGQRFRLEKDADWDVWSHKYNLMGLLTYYRYTGSEPALQAARRIGDLLIVTFPAQRSINAAGTHMGMAATSVLEPVVLLYRLTGDERYLNFARYIVGAYDEEGAPAIVHTLLTRKDVSRTANAKAYEMLSNLVGLCEYARSTGDRTVLTAVTNGWADIVARRLYLTGTTSAYEHFAADHELPNGNEAHVGETCATVTWIQLNLQLLRLTGEAAYADQMERSLYNHLAAAQHPDGADWCYFTALEGVKQYDKYVTCCHSSGPRGMALAPTFAFLRADGALCVNTFESARARFNVNGTDVELVQESAFPHAGRAKLVIHAPHAVRFALRFRVPEWAAPLRIGEQSYAAGWAEIPERDWRDGDQLDMTFTLQGRTIRGEYTNFARTACAWGPFVLAADANRNGKLSPLPELRLESGVAPVPVPGAGPALVFAAKVRGPWDETPRELIMQPFADTGGAGEKYRVWLRTDP
ncbi:MAG: glycoside hydrolase family 127 protein [Candidatus Didemnitutus sp.]|nr:glycoside hydrolase family 127 protein [Candidatus Didemnitutus sp.]